MIRHGVWIAAFAVLRTGTEAALGVLCYFAVVKTLVHPAALEPTLKTSIAIVPLTPGEVAGVGEKFVGYETAVSAQPGPSPATPGAATAVPALAAATTINKVKIGIVVAKALSRALVNFGFLETSPGASSPFMGLELMVVPVQLSFVED